MKKLLQEVLEAERLSESDQEVFEQVSDLLEGLAESLEDARAKIAPIVKLSKKVSDQKARWVIGRVVKSLGNLEKSLDKEIRSAEDGADWIHGQGLFDG